MATVAVTGVAGCIGAWTAFHLLQQGHRVVGIDTADRLHRLALLGIDGRIELHRVDIRDRQQMERLVSRERPDAVIHLAALQIPTCRADPLLCGEVNVLAFLHVLELARRHGFPVVYASSAAVYGPDPGRRLREDEGLQPRTLYGVFKRANEEMARVYAAEYGVRSAGLRPYVVYGPGRDFGVTSDITYALWHAARGEPFRIRFGGRVALQYASDVGRALVRAALDPKPGARVYNLRGVVASVEDVVRAIEDVTGRRGLVTWSDEPLPIAADLDDAAYRADYGPLEETDLRAGLAQTLAVWQAASGRAYAGP